MIFKLRLHLLGAGELSVGILPHKSLGSLVLPPRPTQMRLREQAACDAWLVRYQFKVSISSLLHTFFYKVEYPINLSDIYAAEAVARKCSVGCKFTCTLS